MQRFSRILFTASRYSITWQTKQLVANDVAAFFGSLEQQNVYEYKDQYRFCIQTSRSISYFNIRRTPKGASMSDPILVHVCVAFKSPHHAINAGHNLPFQLSGYIRLFLIN